MDVVNEATAVNMANGASMDKKTVKSQKDKRI